MQYGCHLVVRGARHRTDAELHSSHSFARIQPQGANCLPLGQNDATIMCTNRTACTTWHTTKLAAVVIACCLIPDPLYAQSKPAPTRPADVEGQPLAANIRRVVESLEYLAVRLERAAAQNLDAALKRLDSEEIQQAIDPQVLLVVTIDRDARVNVKQGAAQPLIQQAGFVPVLVKVINQVQSQKRLFIDSPQAGAVYGGVAELSMKRQQQETPAPTRIQTGRRTVFSAWKCTSHPP